jgi:F0F1-type ATP synthase assembly protein I
MLQSSQEMIFDRTILRQVYKASVVGLNIVIATVVGGFLGYLFDYAMAKWFGVTTAPWGLFIGALFGIVSGFKDLFILAKKIEQDTSKKNNDSSE